MTTNITSNPEIRELPTWTLINALAGTGMVRLSRSVLAERMAACGAASLIEVVAAEAAACGVSLPVACPWDPANLPEAGELLVLHPPSWGQSK